MLVNTYLLAGMFLVALALYAEMRWQWVAAGWAPFSVLLLLVAARLNRKSLYSFAQALLAGSLFFLVMNLPGATPAPEALWHPFTSHWALLSYAVFASLLGWLWASTKLPKDLMSTDEFARWTRPMLHGAIALLLFVCITFESTGLHWAVTMQLALAHLGFSVAAVFLFAMTGLTVWFVAAFATQVLVILYTFILGPSSGMVSPLLHGHSVLPFLHPWGAVSVLSIGAMAALLAVLSRKRGRGDGTQVRALLIGIIASQVWVHVSVEIQHLQQAFGWSDALLTRVLSAWWIVYALGFLVAGIRRKSVFLGQVAVALLCVPLFKDLILISQGGSHLYEVGVWTAVPLALMALAARRKSRDLLLAAIGMLVAVMAVDMLRTLGTDSGLLRTVWWGIAGLLTMILGFREREALLRRAAIGIFGATVVKLLLLDFAQLSTGVRIVASILTGLLLIGASYLYQRFDNQLKHDKR